MGASNASPIGKTATFCCKPIRNDMPERYAGIILGGNLSAERPGPFYHRQVGYTASISNRYRRASRFVEMTMKTRQNMPRSNNKAFQRPVGLWRPGGGIAAPLSRRGKKIPLKLRPQTPSAVDMSDG